MSDAVVVGAGPNGLAAAVTLARAGLSVKVYELASQLGGGTRSAALTLPGFLHDVCSAVHPMALASPFFQEFGLAERMELRVPEVSYAHPLDDGRAGIAYRDLNRTVAELGRDGAAYRRLFAPLLARVEGITDFTQHPLLRIPADPIAAFRYALAVAEQGSLLGDLRFRGEAAPAMIAGVSAHSIGKIPSLATAGAGLLLGTLAHAGGWPVPIGGSQAIADAMAADFSAHGGEIVLNHRVESLAQLKAETGAKIQLLDVSASGLLEIAGTELPSRFIRSLRRFRYGPGACKVDFALSGPVPWTNPELAAVATLHLAGTKAEIARSEAQVAAGQHPEQPYVLVSQPSPHDASRAPLGQQVLWSYCHVPAGSTVDMTEAVVRQIERFAPGFRDVVLASKVITAAEYAHYNPNYIGGDFSAGAVTIRQLLKRPVVSARPWRTPIPGLYLGSSSTAPGPSVHGLCGWYAAQTALKDVYGLAAPDLSPSDAL
ncbi:phytoene desaturase family protein [Psychromicrobium lacuslunae]|uniref:Pyridine nucleotide-disulfide oxidoreductase domain-containing protein 2 n=1 Tax=Psychromicrobium lacuslunae TaxID=1618207 RepID=A0A0D4C104_9MICC|nr:NAD(P)/FAD-dependent oxidoreductase [Psychromicrobium lacuslunae]AJT42273.1 dehydrogenase [Psychromicrobium lacuslunae]